MKKNIYVLIVQYKKHMIFMDIFMIVNLIKLFLKKLNKINGL